ncbi:MAG: hypothetical protein P8L74_03390 [Gammaproteobacteria bacterium]|jgi:hypothetical protein|nr:hypothetical protein [Gammaproteobacteria bacterium]
MIPGVCSECQNRILVDEITKTITTYCEHNKTGALTVPLESKIRWLAISPITAERFKEYVSDLLGRALKGVKKDTKESDITYN